MNRTEYAAAARAAYDRPLDSTETPPGQKFSIGQHVRAIDDAHALWGFKKGDIATIEYSYYQKYGWMTGDSQRNREQYSIKFGDNNTLAWIDESEIEAVPTP